jgi:hypothetical protein
MPRIDNQEHRDMRRGEKMKKTTPTPHELLKEYKRREV